MVVFKDNKLLVRKNMSFEPLIHVSELHAVLIISLWAGLVTLIIGGLTYIDLRRKNHEMTEELLFSRISLPFIICWSVIGLGIQSDQIAKNEAIVFKNVSQKYEVEEIKFAPATSTRQYRDYYPEQSEPQPVMIKANGVTRPAILEQDRETSEPTLLDVDNGKSLDGLLRIKP
jgi:hypothetical protein